MQATVLECVASGSRHPRVRREITMAALIGLVVGALVGGLFLGQWGTVIGGLGGFFVGAIFTGKRDREAHRRPDMVEAPTAGEPAAVPEGSLSQRVVRLERRVDELERSLRLTGAVAA